MPAKTDAIRKLVEERLAELDREREELEEALDEMVGRRRSTKNTGSGNGSGNATPESSPRPGRRRRKGGTRAEHAVKAVADNPGIKASEVAEKLNIKPNYVYRVMAELVKEGRVIKKGTGYFPPETPAE